MGASLKLQAKLFYKNLHSFVIPARFHKLVRILSFRNVSTVLYRYNILFPSSGDNFVIIKDLAMLYGRAMA
jgi:hypothetical protein